MKQDQIPDYSGDDEAERIAYNQFIIAAYDAPFALIEAGSDKQKEAFLRMQSYALHNPDFYNPIEFSTNVVSFYRDDL